MKRYKRKFEENINSLLTNLFKNDLGEIEEKLRDLNELKKQESLLKIKQKHIEVTLKELDGVDDLLNNYFKDSKSFFITGQPELVLIQIYKQIDRDDLKNLSKIIKDKLTYYEWARFEDSRKLPGVTIHFKKSENF